MPYLLPFCFDETPLLWTVDDVLTPEECRAEIADIEARGPRIATNNPMYRNQDRVMRDDPSTAQRWFDRLRPHLPAQLGPLIVDGLNERLRSYRYRGGQAFSPHMDHWYAPRKHTITLLTVLLYLNEDFDGGQTRFIEPLEAVVEPRPGRVAIFQHKIRHEGVAVTRGVKYAIRTDVMYAHPESKEILDPRGSLGFDIRAESSKACARLGSRVGSAHASFHAASLVRSVFVGGTRWGLHANAHIRDDRGRIGCSGVR